MGNTDIELSNLIKAERKAWSTMQRGPVESACTIKGQEGANYLAWCAAADAQRHFRKSLREAHGVLFSRIGNCR
jgi:hypothetical protein